MGILNHAVGEFVNWWLGEFKLPTYQLTNLPTHQTTTHQLTN
jgi:hypothetical protein